MQPLFIFSLPRAGSTLLQRVLSADPKISTVAEPWILLPMIYPLKESGVEAEYSHRLTNRALQDFITQLPQGRDDYYEAIGSAVSSLYEKSAKSGSDYFIDKTPRYSLVSEHIINIFPEGKFIMLWRNPLSVIASLIETFGGGKWVLHHFKSDLYPGVLNLIDTYNANQDKCLAIKYEYLVSEPEKNLQKISSYLDIQLDSECLTSFSGIRFEGRLGDPTGINQYMTLDRTPINKWKDAINNPLRKWWCKRYLKWLGRDNLALMGYDLEALLSELDGCETSMKYLIHDVAMMIYGSLLAFFELRRLCTNFKKVLSREPLILMR